MPMSEIEIRLEALKLANSPASGTGAVLEKAREFEAFIKGPAKVAEVAALSTLSLPGKKGPTPPKGAG